MKTHIAAIALLASVQIASAQSPGWVPTGEWQCGPHVRIVVSTDGQGGLDWYVRGAWFDNHYTVQRGQLYYNGIPCMALGNPWPNVPRQAVNNDEVEEK